MGFKWDSESQSWVNDEVPEPGTVDTAPAPAPDPMSVIAGATSTPAPTGVTGDMAKGATATQATPGAPTTAPGAWQAKPDYSGGFLSDIGAFLEGGQQEAGQLLRATPGAIVEGIKDVGRAIRYTGEKGYSDLIAPVIPGHPGTEKTEAYPGHPEGGEAYKTGFVKEMDAKLQGAVDAGVEQRGKNLAGAGQGLLNALEETPVARFDPHVYWADKAAKGRAGLEEVAQEPLVAALNALPVANTVTKKVTKGKPIAQRAEERLAGSGEFNRAAQVAEQGAGIRDVVGQAVRETAPGQKAAQMLEESALGGAKVRDTLRRVGTYERKYQKDLDRYVRGKVDEAVSEFNMTPEDVVGLTKKMEFPEAGDWKSKLPRNQQDFLRWYEGEIAHFKKLGMGEGKLFEFEGETYATSEAPALAKWTKRMSRVKPLEEMVTYQRAREAGTRALETGLLEGMTPGELVAYAPDLMKKWQDIRVRKAAQVERINERMRNAADVTAPTRFRPLIMRSDDVVDRIIKTVRPQVDEAEWSFTEQAIREGRGLDFLDDAQRQALVPHVGRSWRKLKQAGFDPVYVHHVPLDAVERGLGKFQPYQIRNADDVKRRGWDMKPWAQDATVALSHQAADWTRKQHATDFVDDLVRTGTAKSQAAIRKTAYQSVARSLRRQFGDTIPEGRIAHEVDQYIAKHYEVFDPNTMFGGKAGLGGRGAYYVPKGIAKVFEQLANPPRAPRLQSGVGKVFRYSVLYLNPFYYIDNAISGALLSAARSDLGVLNPMRIRRAWNLMHSDSLPDSLSVGGSRYASFEESQRGWRRASVGAALGDEFMKRYLRQSNGNIAKAGAQASSFLERLAASTDDMWKTVTYLNEFEKLTKKGVAKEAAIARAVETAHKVLMNFSEMTPFERATVRAMLPFYSWTRHILRYVMTYPFDHPHRASFVTNLSDQMREEWDYNLPERFMKYFQLSRNEDGTLLFPNTGIMPWVAVGDITDDPLKGFLVRLDPKFQAIAEARGLDPFTLAPDLYLKEKVNPISGYPEPVLPSPFEAFLHNVVPQTEVLQDAFMPDEDLAAYYEENPERRKESLLRMLLGKTTIRRDLDEEKVKYMKRKSKSDAYWAKQEAEQGKVPATASASGGSVKWNQETQSWEVQ